MNETYKHYAIGFLAAVVLMALMRLVIMTHNGGLKSHADEGRDYGSEALSFQDTSQMDAFVWIFTGVNIGNDVPDTSTCFMIQDDNGDRHYNCGPGQ
ncbi:MAG TPA: hypothetical protein VHQ20_01675 [Patescibacteria group bacterium]|nr:hypothetical protein [Patescibacteria group bacterium]